MKLSRQLLAIIGRLNPAIYDFIFPHGPIGHHATHAALNPQPLPPVALGGRLANEFARALWTANRFGLDQKAAFDELDDWCPTGRKVKIKLPPWWPPIPEPEPGPDWLVSLHFGFASRLAVIAESVTDKALAKAMDQAIERSIGAIETTVG